MALITCIIIAGCISESGTVESPAVSPGYTISDSANGTTTPSDTGSDNSSSSEASASQTTSNATTPAKESNSSFSISDVPAYSGSPYAVINNNIPYFTESDYTTSSYEYYSDLDSLGRCGVCVASIGKDLMPTEERGSIGSVKPTGWHTVKYDNVDGKYLYNRCHLIGYQLSGENANTKNLITGTRYLNIQGKPEIISFIVRRQFLRATISLQAVFYWKHTLLRTMEMAFALMYIATMSSQTFR